MTMWKRERKHFRYYVTNERKQPHIYVEALGTPSASTEKVLKDHGFILQCKNSIIYGLCRECREKQDRE